MVVPFDCRELTILVKQMTRKKQWQEALHMMQQVDASGIRPDLLLLNTVASSLAAGDDWRRCCHQLEDFRAVGYQIDVFTVGAVLTAAVKCKKWRQALALGKDETNIAISNNFISALTEKTEPAVTAVWPLWPLALTTLSRCLTHGLRLSQASYVAVTSLFRGSWDRAMHFAALQGFYSSRFLETLNIVLSACEVACSWDRALALVMLGNNGGLQTDTISFSSLVSACEKALRWRWALQSLQTTLERHIYVDRTLLNAVISAQEKGSTWLRAVTLTMQMRRVFGCQPNVVSFNAASSACEKAYRWTSSIQLFDWAKERSVEVDTISGNALLAACRGARRWCEVLQLLKVFFVSNLFLDDLALRMALEAQLDRPATVATVELLSSMDHLWISVLSRNVSKSWQGLA